MHAVSESKPNVEDNDKRAKIFDEAYAVIEFLNSHHNNFMHYSDPKRDAEIAEGKFSFINEFMRNNLKEMERL